LRLRFLALLFCVASTPSLLPAQALNPSGVVIVDHWRTQAGDNPAWASPGFDDAVWDAVTDTNDEGKARQASNGYRWYRTAIALPAALREQDLSIGAGQIEEVYEIYVEGVSVGRFGRWTPSPAAPFARNLTFPIPRELTSTPLLHIAIRSWSGISTTYLFTFYTSGAARFPRRLELGPSPTITARTHLFIAEGVVKNLPWPLSLLLLIVAGLVCLVLYSTQVRHTEYLLLGIYCVGAGFLPRVASSLALTGWWMSRSWGPFLISIFYSASLSAIFLFLAVICPRFHRWLVLGAVLEFLFFAGGAVAIVAQSRLLDFIFWRLGIELPMAFMLLPSVGLLLEREAGAVAIAITILIRQAAESWVATLSVLTHKSDLRYLPLGPFLMDIRAVTQVLFVLVTLVVLYLRYRKEQERQVSLEQDIASARRMQEQLLAQSALSVPGFAIEAVYRPAQE